jgi:archaemetzincin
MSETLNLVQLGSTLDYPVGKLREKVAQKFPDYQVRTLRPLDTPIMAFDSFRVQYHSTRILAFLEEYAQTVPAEHILGVASFDLYVPGMNFVFGEARCPGRVAVISTHRLKTKHFDESHLFGSRVVKEAVHEIGHMMGLRHCSERACVMYFSERLADTDRKADSFCCECERKMKWLEIE